MPSDAPSRTEVAQALSRAGPERIGGSDVSSVDCGRRVADGYDCRWQQRVDGEWQPRTGRIGIDGTGWRLMAVVR